VHTPNGTPAEQALVAFLLALTDNHVQKEKAPFDHPQLFVAVDGTAPALNVSKPTATFSSPKFKELPATGKGGGPALKTFLGLSPFLDNTGKGDFVESN